MNDKTDRASEIMKQMEFVEQLTQKRKGDGERRTTWTLLIF